MFEIFTIKNRSPYEMQSVFMSCLTYELKPNEFSVSFLFEYIFKLISRKFRIFYYFALKIIAVSLSFALSGCSILELQKEMQIRALKTEEAALSKVLDKFQSGVLPNSENHVSIFLSSHLINAALKELEGHEFKISGDEIKGKILKVRTDFSSGFPKLDLKAQASYPRWNTTLDLETVAVLTLETGYQDGTPALVARLQPVEITPILKVGTFSISAWVLAAIISCKNGKIDIPEFHTTMPLKSTLEWTQPASSTTIAAQMQKGILYGKFTNSQISTTLSLEFSDILVLKDGIHVYAKLK